MPSRKPLLLVVAASLVVGLLALANSSEAATNEPPGFNRELLLDELRLPTAIAFLPDGTMLVTGREGGITISHPNDPSLSGSPYLTIPHVGNEGERGLAAIAVDPEFPTEPYIYVYYANFLTDKPRISRFTHQGATADLSSEFVVWEDTETFDGCCHVGGVLLFGPDGKLWLALGDKSQNVLAQDLAHTHGKLIRINKDGTIPEDNPYFGNTNGWLEEIWARGFRNPWKGSWDAVTGTLWIGEVGQETWEDIHVIDPANGGGENFGWPHCEGPCPEPEYDSPIYSYQQDVLPWTDSGGSVTGGPVYRGSAYPSEWYGRYFFGDFANNRIMYLTFNPDGSVFDPDPSVAGDEAFEFAHTANSPVDIQVGPDGYLYRVSIQRHGHPNMIESGHVVRYVHESGQQPPVITQAEANPTSGDGPLTVTFTGAATDAESPAADLTYTWFFGDGTVATGATVAHTYTQNGVYSARLQVADTAHTTLSDPITIQVGIPPAAQIASPPDGLVFQAADVIDFSANTSGNDPGDTYIWTVLFGHNDHTHPVWGPAEATSGQFIVPTEQGHSFFEDTSYQFFLTVEDNSGLATTEQVTIWPDKANLDFTTNPPGLQVKVDSISLVSPMFDSLVGFHHVIEVTDGQCLGTERYDFVGWSDNGAQSHEITVPETDTAYTATFAPTGASCSVDVPMAPSGLTVVGRSTTFINLTWTDNSFDEAGFAIQRAASLFETVAMADADSRSFVATGLEPETEYCFRVVAVNESGSSEYSNVACATTAAPSPVDRPGLVSAGSEWSVMMADGRVHSFFFGYPGDIAFIGDWDCDGIDTPGLYRQSDGFVYLRNSLSTGFADIQFFFGIEGDVPIAADFDGDGCDTIGVFRKGHVFVSNSLGANDGFFVAEDDFWFGTPGDVPFSGDFDGDGKDELGLRRPTTGFVYFTLAHPVDGGVATTHDDFFYGIGGDRVLAGDWIGQGIDTIAIHRPSVEEFYLRYSNTLGVADEVAPFDGNGQPLSGHFE